jgi:putative phosphoribosyl transferase
MDAEGHAILDYRAVVTLGLGEAEIESIKADANQEMAARAALHPPPRPRDFLTGHAVVLVDEALAAGLRMQAAIGHAKSLGATATIVAVPCGSDRAVYEVRSLLGRAGDRLICLQVDGDFRAARDYYQSFPPVSDTEVAQLLEDAASRCAGDSASPGLRRGILA